MSAALTGVMLGASASGVAQASTPVGPLYGLAGQYIKGDQSYDVGVCYTDSSEPIRRVALTEDSGYLIDENILSASARSHADDCSGAIWTTVNMATRTEGAHTYQGFSWDTGTGEYASDPWTVTIDRSAPSPVAGVHAAASATGAVVVHWIESTDPPLPDATPGSGVARYEVRYRLNGGAWSAWQSTANPWIAVPGADADDQIGVEARAVDAVGNASATTAATVTVAANVVRAQVWVEEPGQGVTYDAIEAFIPTTGLSRYEELDSISTRNIVGCTTPAGACVEYRQRSRLAETNPAAADTFVRYRGTTPFDDRIPYAGDADDLRSVGASNVPDDTGATSNVKFSWQTLPPGAGTTYELYDSEIGLDEVAGTAVDGPSGEIDTPATRSVRTRLVVDAATNLPLRLTKFDTTDGSLLDRRVWSYDASTTPVTSLPADYFSITAPTNLRLDKQIEYSDQVPSQLLSSARTSSSAGARAPELDTSKRVTNGRLCFSHTQRTRFYEAATTPWAAQLGPWLGKQQARDTTYYRLAGPRSECPDSGDPDVVVESTSLAGELAGAWKTEYQDFGTPIRVPGTSLKSPSVAPLRLDGVANGRGYALNLGVGRRAAYFEKGSKAFVIRGRIASADVQTLVSALED